MEATAKQSRDLSRQKIVLIVTTLTIFFALIVLMILFFRQTDDRTTVYADPSGAYCFRYPFSWTLVTYTDAGQKIPNLRDPKAVKEGVTYQEMEKLREGIYMEVAASVPMEGQEQLDVFTPDGALADDLAHDRQLVHSVRRTLGGENSIVADIDPSPRSEQAGGVSAMYRSIAYVRHGKALYYVLAFFKTPETRQRHAKEFSRILKTFSFRGDCSFRNSVEQ